jgi:hypothetical protein
MGPKKKTAPYYISIQKEYFVLSDGSMHKRPDSGLVWPNTDQVIPEESVVSQHVSINPTFIKQCADALGIDSDNPVTFGRRLGTAEPYVIRGNNGMAIIMPGRIGDETDLGIVGKDDVSKWFIEMTNEYLKGITLGYTEGMSAPKGTIPTLPNGCSGYMRGYDAGWNRALADKEIRKND